ncbi:ribokinase [Olivibacter domesticus]|uniref:Ribokinase n=1 Tax=Olivibacter domesticus TaxID=407022 RepID=A0A1H7W644_OLID1|nr:ribokinase [Olivibacter domesticus]SEM16535.1 ribokinase [Olivibacter domesticus]
MSSKIIVVGSSNMDMVVKSTHIPAPGETVLGGDFLMNPGGKGANQAVAAARLGGKVAFITKIGNYIFGHQLAQLFGEEEINMKGILADANSPSGIALITVDEVGENSIVVAPGANAHLNKQDVITKLKAYPAAKIILLQLEIPIETVEAILRYAQEKDIRIMVNPAPVNKRILNLFPFIDILTPNAKEAEMLSGIAISDIETAKLAASEICKKGVKEVIITLGKLGAIQVNKDGARHIEAPQVAAIDTTAAGDVFNGAIAVYLAEGKTLLEAISFACKAAAIAVTKLGAYSSIPYRKEVLLANTE